MFCTGIITPPATARELWVGPTRALKVPSQAASIVAAGDRVQIDAGTYTDCAIWSAPRLVIEAVGGSVLISGKTCAGKGIFVTEGADITIRGLTFARAVVPEHNGAGIRASGDNLRVEHSRFLDNENGVFAGGSGDSVLHITDSDFIGNGTCVRACAHGVYAGAPIALLDIEHCVFLNTKVGHHIKSRARSTIVRDSRIEDGPTGTASYLIDVPNGGNVLIEGNTMEKGARSENAAVAIAIGEEGVTNPMSVVTIRDNRFRSDVSMRTAFVRIHAATPVDLSGNSLSGAVEPLVHAEPRR